MSPTVRSRGRRGPRSTKRPPPGSNLCLVRTTKPRRWPTTTLQALELRPSCGPGRRRARRPRARRSPERKATRAYSLGSGDGSEQALHGRLRTLARRYPRVGVRLVVRLRRTTLFHRFEHKELLRARDALITDGDLEGAAEAELFLGWDAWNEGRGKDASLHHERSSISSTGSPPATPRRTCSGVLRSS